MQNTSKSLLMCERNGICIWECFSHILIQMCTGADKAVIFRIIAIYSTIRMAVFWCLRQVKGEERLLGLWKLWLQDLGFILSHWNFVLRFQDFWVHFIPKWNSMLRFQGFGLVLSQWNFMLFPRPAPSCRNEGQTQLSFLPPLFLNTPKLRKPNFSAQSLGLELLPGSSIPLSNSQEIWGWGLHPRV